MIFDTHAHYNDNQFDSDRDALIRSFAENGVEAAVNIGADLDSSRKSLELTEQYPFFYAAAGVHPCETGGMTEQDMDMLAGMCTAGRTVAVGEIGLDYYWKDVPKEIQKKWFVRQLELAEETGLPVVIHSRDAAQDTFDIMSAQNCGAIGGVIHCFSYSREMAAKYLDMGFYLGIGGILTFKNSRRLKEVAAYAPLDRLVLETDAPYLAPEPYRGKRNCSLYLDYVAEELARLRGIQKDEVLRATNQNAKALYRIAG